MRIEKHTNNAFTASAVVGGAIIQLFLIPRGAEMLAYVATGGLSIPVMGGVITPQQIYALSQLVGKGISLANLWYKLYDVSAFIRGENESGDREDAGWLRDTTEFSANLLTYYGLWNPFTYQKVTTEPLPDASAANTGGSLVPNIMGYSIEELKAFSKYGSKGKNGIKNPMEGWVSLVDNPAYSNEVLKVNSDNEIDAINGYLRNNDTEYKIMEKYNQILNGDYGAEGKITIVSERKICPSCDNVIKAFSRDYSNIEITVIDGTGKTYIVKNGVVK